MVEILLTGRLHPTSPHGRDGVREDGPDQRHHQAVQERNLRDHVSLMKMTMMKLMMLMRQE